MKVAGKWITNADESAAEATKVINDHTREGWHFVTLAETNRGLFIVFRRAV